MSVMVTTDSVPEQDRIAFWHEAVSRTLVPMEVSARGGGPFDGRMATDRVGCLQVTTVEADAQRVSRTRTLIARSPRALVAVGVQTSGTAAFLQDGRRAEVGEGDLVLYDTTRPFSFDYPGRFTARVFQVPRRALGAPDSALRQATGRAIGTADGFGAILLPFLTNLASTAGSHPPAVATRLSGMVVELFDTLIAEESRSGGPDTDTAGHLVRRVRDHVDRNLLDPDLCPARLAAAHGISVRYLHRLFEGEGITVSRLIRQRRLEECGRELARRGRTAPSVSAVAQRWGFVSPAHFSRAFRAAYGVTPTEWRDLSTTRQAADLVQAAG
ncbi:helix-turn-helix domain-containing protein [Streptomyces sp. adm13(2018)]|uniref:AraC-like ligand-binding domain-containing protein n=1 Tax=Streptomyces sp. adm13(2018) TaxID=2479007 RepID=UPI0011CDE69D|nr:helix-turn-helix domain-containing protein [Streptomyces sp. adm13(2018)]